MSDAREAPVRAVVPADLPALKGVIDGVGLFPSAMLDAMIAPFFAAAESGEFWLTYDDGGPCAVVYVAPERMTDGAWNMLLIAVDPARQGQGIGAALTRRVERKLAADGARLLLVETSGLDHYARTRAFYAGLGYSEEARIRDYYQAGEDKIVFRKALGN